MRAFIGMGLLGSNFVRALLQKGEEVNVWNRTASKAKALEQYGAKSFEEVAEAVQGADLIHVTLKDDKSVDEVLEAASTGLKSGAIIIDHTTTSKEGAIKRTKYWSGRGFYYQHAPVFMGPANARESSGFMLLSGDPELIARVEPSLSMMTGKLLHFGADPGKAAAMKLVGNAFLICFTAGIRDTLCLSKALGLSVNDLSSLFDTWNPGEQLKPRLEKMTSGNFTNASWELSMARKDTGLFIDAAQHGEASLAVLPAVASLMDFWIEEGYGDNDWTVIAKDCV